MNRFVRRIGDTAARHPWRTLAGWAVLAALVEFGPAGRSEGGSGGVVALLGGGLDSLDGYFARYLPQLIATAVATPGEDRIALGTARVWMTDNLGAAAPNRWRVLPWAVAPADCETSPVTRTVPDIMFSARPVAALPWTVTVPPSFMPAA